MLSVHKPNGVVTATDCVKIPDISFVEQVSHVEESETMPQVSEPEGDDRFIETILAPIEELPQASFTPLVMSHVELTEYYHAELEALRCDTIEQAYADAVMKKRGELTDCIKKVETELEEIQNQHNHFMRKYAQELKFLAIDVAEKIIIEKIREDDKMLKKLVMQTVDSIRSSSWLDIELSEKLAGLIDDVRGELHRAELQGRITISPKACSVGTCRVNSEDGTVVSSIQAQAENLRKLFRDTEES